MFPRALSGAMYKTFGKRAGKVCIKVKWARCGRLARSWGWWLIVLPALLSLVHCTKPSPRGADTPLEHSVDGIQPLDVPFYPQKSWTGCGASVIAGVLNYWDFSVNPDEILERYPAQTPTRGYTLGELKRIAQHSQVHAFAFKADLTTLETHLAAGRPLIVPLKIDPSLPFLPDYDHYVIVTGLDRPRGYIFLIDPQLGPHARKLAEFNRQWQEKSYAVLLIAP